MIKNYLPAVQTFAKSQILILTLFAALAASLPRIAMAASEPNPSDAVLGNPGYVVVVVRIPIPAAFDHEKVIALMKQSVPKYTNLPGLVRKYFTISDDNRFGGVYLFTDRASAERQFDTNWMDGAKKAFGATPDVFYLSSPVQIDGRG